ncbi:AI-2E family transporter [Plectonema cf. radiosum LEGE 06105]|uniref:AI-2E family transporter n=1 Tax=Plectonema cf. radiosum LEGE 06105 TaxID=945769 RepID=A0A8J7F0I8_9CYAN|nr:AI-2E family transporter [Plectonema radiosum]MBE9212265.1 AI-2E family transporter [Plectonema cf. radiosum LEGE 06105]
MQLSNKTTQILMAIIAIILIVAALKATQPISMPLAFAFFIVILVHPVQSHLEHRLPRWLSLILVLLLLLGILGLGVGILSLSAEIIEPKVPQYLNQLQQMVETAESWASSRGLPIGQFTSNFNGSLSQFTQQAIGGVKSLLSTISLFVLVVSLLVLLLLEVSQYRKKVQRAFSSRTGDRIIDAVGNTSEKLRRYILVMTLTSFLTGILTGIWCFVLGVDLAFVWGLIAFVLNYIPTLGSIIAVIPPTLVAFIFQGAGGGVATLIGLAVIQVVMGNFVDPWVEGKSLQLSPFIALVSIVFWGWVWGIPGAILGVPMTISIILFCQEFDATRGVAIVLGKIESSPK